jgi:F-type H+-transporting ATPase subunit delta
VKNIAIARRYAKALLLIGKEDGQTEAYRKELQTIADLFVRAPELDQSISNPLYDVENRRSVLETIVGKLNFSETMTAFMMLVFDKGRMGFVGGINEYYQKIADELKGVARAELVSATELSTVAVEKIRKSLSDMTGKAVILSVKQDSSLIGGVVTKLGDLVLDGSIRTQLLNMKDSLKRGERV